jgi:hypothetical protein
VRRGELHSRVPLAFLERRRDIMDCSILFWPKWGLIFNFIGTIFVALSVGKNPGDAHQYGKWGKIYLAVFYALWFRIGLSLLAFGFLFNLFIF